MQTEKKNGFLPFCSNEVKTGLIAFYLLIQEKQMYY